MARERRLVFGEVAEEYDRHRPGYPSALIDDLADFARDGGSQRGDRTGPGRALEVGAGTGKATTLLAARGVAVLAIEPSPPMAAVARRNCAPYSGVEIKESDFEHWEPEGASFRLIYSAQAWHWVDPAVRYVKARQVLEPGGVLAVFWNVPAWGPSPMREALSAAYRDAVPDLRPDGPMHPDNHTTADEDDWVREIEPLDGIGDPAVRTYDWRLDYDAAAYTALLGTLSETRLLDPDSRLALLAAVAATIDSGGGTLQMPMRTLLWLARAV